MSDTNNKGGSNLARFSGLGIQMGIIIGGFAWLGTFLDKKYHTNTPWWTVGLSLFGVGAAMYLMIKEVIKSNRENNDD